MKKKFFIILVFFFICACSVNENNGILGIEVPVGQGEVSDDAPYIVVGVYEEGPAYKAGIRPGDVILQIDDVVISRGMKYDDIYNNNLLGRAGTRIVICIKREDKKMVFEMIRAKR